MSARAVVIAASALLLSAASARAQQVRTVVTPDTATVGDVVRAAVRVDVPAGMRVVLPDSLPLQGDLENAGPRRDTTVAAADGAQTVTYVYSLTPWRPGAATLPAVDLRVEAAGRQSTLRVPLGTLVVKSVLPADTTGIEMKPARAVVGKSWLLWPWIVAVLLALLVLIGLYVWWRRRRGRVAPALVETDRSAREIALAEIDRARALQPSEAAQIKQFYVIISEALRHYLAATDARWSPDLTTSELTPRLRDAYELAAIADVERVLKSADLVKFAKVRPERAQLEQDWQRARAWVQRFPPEPVVPVEEQAA